MTEWPTRTLEDVCAEGGGFVRTGPFGSQLHKSDYVDDPDGIPVVMPKNMSGGAIDLDGIARIDAETAARLSQHLFSEGDVALSRRGDVGRTAFVDVEDLPAFCGTGCLRVHLGTPESVQPQFLRYFFRSRLASDYLEGHAVGATMPNLNAGIVNALPIPVPPQRVQAAIGSVLGSIDDLIENNRRRVEMLEEMARAFYLEWFVHFRFPGHEHVTFVDSDFGPIPEGWAVRTLAAIADVNRESRTPVAGQTFRYLDISCLGERRTELPDMLDGADAPGRARRVVRPGDVVWSTVRPNRRAHALLVNPGADWIASTGIAVLTATSVPSSFLFEAVSQSSFTDHLVSRQRGSAYPAVKVQDFKDAMIATPTGAVLDRFEEAVGSMHQLSWQLQTQSNALAQIRDVLLPKLVTGQIDVSDLDLDALVERAVV